MAFNNIFSKRKKEETKIRIIVDYREKNSLVAAHLVENGFVVDWQQLPVADYIVNGIAIERKTVSDLKSSIIDKRIFQQLEELKQYEKNLLIVEGILEEDVYSGGLHENAFRGFMLSAVLEYAAPIIFTRDSRDTAKYIAVLARKQEKPASGVRASKIFLTKEEQAQFILEGFPHVGAVKAKKLIEKLGSLEKIFSASEEQLSEILGKRAKDFRELIACKLDLNIKKTKIEDGI